MNNEACVCFLFFFFYLAVTFKPNYIKLGLMKLQKKYQIATKE